MRSSKSNIEHLISRKISGDITNEELEQLFSWISKSDKNAQIYKDSIRILLKDQSQNRKEAVWERIHNNISKQSDQKHIDVFSIRKIWRIAVVLVLIAIIPIVLGILGDDHTGLVNTVKGNDVTTLFYLPDGSKVILSRGSEISYDEEYSLTNRELTLKGKAYIEINNDVADESLPVIITSGKHCAIARDAKLLIEGKSGNLDIAVEEGVATIVDTMYKKVIVPMVKLVPAKRINTTEVDYKMLNQGKVCEGERITYSAMGDEAKTDKWDHCEVFSWKDRVFCFRNLKQHELAVKISEWFGKSVEFKGEMNPYHNYSGSFDNPDAKEMVKAIFGDQIKEVKETKRKITVIFS